MSQLPSGWESGTGLAPVEDIEQQFKDKIYKEIGAVVDNIIFDGKIHRFKTADDDAGEKSGWYVGYNDKIAAGCFGDWREPPDISGKPAAHNWCEKENGVERSAAEWEIIREYQRRAAEVRKKEEEELHKKAAIEAKRIYASSKEVDYEHPYLVKKQIRPQDPMLRIATEGKYKDCLVVPIFIDGNITSLQFIPPDGKEKRYLTGGAIAGGYHTFPIQDGAPDNVVYIAEGYATAASIHRVTGALTFMALDAGNVMRVAQYVGEYVKKSGKRGKIIIVGDNDKSGKGQEVATNAAKAIGAKVVIPPITGMDANDYAVAGHDLLALLQGAKETFRYFFWNELTQQPQPLKWLIKGWVQQDAQMMIFGESGSGKTFAALDMALSIACPEIETWCGQKINHGPVAYWAGEGQYGMRKRCAGWANEKGVKGPVKFFLHDAPFSIDNDAEVEEAIKATERQAMEEWGQLPSIIFIDTLNKFFAGDENKAQDAAKMIRNCEKIRQRLHCTVVYLHHSGLNENAQHRARGSSAWRAAMDIEIKVTRAGDKLILAQTKNKDAERQAGFEMAWNVVVVSGWFDEEGQEETTVVLEYSRKITSDSDKSLSDSAYAGLELYEQTIKIKGILLEDGTAGLKDNDWRDVFYPTCPSNVTPRTKCRHFDNMAKELIEAQILTFDKKRKIYIFAGDYWATRGEGILKGLSGK